jgi:SNF2 family DNA or RNA helicase
MNPDPNEAAGAAFLAANYRASIVGGRWADRAARAIRARELVKADRTIVICPAGERRVWPSQFRRSARAVPACSIFDLINWQRGKVDVLVMSYEQAVNWSADIASDFFDALIIDESHYLKNPEAGRTRRIIGAKGDGDYAISGFASYAWCLTGVRPVAPWPGHACLELG